MSDLEYQLKEAIQKAFEGAFEQSVSLDDIVIEIPKDKAHGGAGFYQFYNEADGIK